MQSPERYEELDALRGVAALIVFVYHCILLMSAGPAWLMWLTKTPFGLVLFGGHQAVILFFVLSGFVLFLPYKRPGRHAPYSIFVLKRFCRIYLPYLGALLFFILAYVLFYKQNRPAGLSDLYAWRALSFPTGLVLLRDHLFFLGFFHREYWNGATWTLAEELRISLIYPLIASLVLRFRARTMLLVGLSLSVGMALLIGLTHHRTPFMPFHYVSLFIVGSLIAANLPLLLASWHLAGKVKQIVLACTAVLFATYAPLLTERFPRMIPEIAADWLIVFGVSIFILAALAQTRFSALLRHRLVLRLGTLSYGMYLLHLPVLFVFVNLLWGHVPALYVFTLTFVTTIALAQAFHLYLELPAIALGKRLSLSLQSRAESKVRSRSASLPTLNLESTAAEYSSKS